MRSSSLTSKGQVTIPSEIREQLGLHPGDRVGFIIEKDHVVLFRRQHNIEAAFGLCRPKRSASLEEMEEAIRQRGRHEDAGG
jgi:AbrB family looped-hinge helix DNA binding protein